MSAARARWARRSPAGDDGFLYVEVLIGLLILSVALLALAPMFVLATRQNAVSTDMTVAAALAQGKAQELRATAWSSLTAGSGQDVLTHGGLTYQRSWLVEDDTPHADMKRVTVSVQPTRLSSYGNARVAQLVFNRAR